MKNKIPFRIKCNMCGKLFRSGNDPETGLPNGVGFQLEDGSIYNMCCECICKVGDEELKNGRNE